MIPEVGSRWRANAIDARAVEVWEVKRVLQVWQLIGSEIAEQEGLDPAKPFMVEVEVLEGVDLGHTLIMGFAIFDDTVALTRLT